ncbi:MAG TPA: cytochrome P450 [Nocardioides sp.]|nr:cytochrome P450 [Nocardioides sp.]
MTFVETYALPLARTVRLNIRAAVLPYRLGRLGYAGAPLTDYDPLDPDTASQPHAAYRRLHASAPVHYNPRTATWVISGLEEAKAALRDVENITSEEGVTRIKTSVALLVSTDGEAHAAQRRQVLPAFTKGALDSWRPIVDRLAKEHVAALVANPGADVVRQLAIPLPVRIIGDLLGVPDKDGADFRRWSEAAVQFIDFSPTLAGLKKTGGALVSAIALSRYLRAQLANGQLKAEGSVLGRLLEHRAEGTMTDGELMMVALLLLMAGNETTTNLLGGMFDTLGRDPQQYALIRSNPDLIPMAIEEQLRHTSPLQNLYRTARHDYEVAGVTIPAGSRVLVSFGAANRDPRAFAEPDEYRVDRNPKGHIAFGYGPHLCLGATLARMEAQAVLRELAGTVSEIRALGDTTWSTNGSLRGPTSLRVALTPA